ncbi:MAG: hypothetical protein H6998_20670 [Hahellaceae bacterium]|nr:hypothetical protein [Hahellaceae bacterium]
MNISILTGPGIVDSKASNDASDILFYDNHRITGITEFNNRFYQSLSGWQSRPQGVLNHYNQQRRALLSIAPSDIHYAITALSRAHTVNLVTFNTDNLHERSGAVNVLHLQGTIMEARCDYPAHQCVKLLDYTTPMRQSDHCKHDRPYRPNVIFFEEEVSNYQRAVTQLLQGDLLLCIGCTDRTPLLESIVRETKRRIPVHFLSNTDAMVSLTNVLSEENTFAL